MTDTNNDLKDVQDTHTESTLKTAGRAFTSRFFLLSLVVVLIGGIAVASMIQKRIEASMLDSYARTMAGGTTATLKGYLNPEDFDKPFTGKRYVDFKEFSEKFLFSEDVVRIKVWNAEGTVLYSDKKEIIGQNKGVHPALKGAMEGKMEPELTNLKADENAGERSQYNRLIEIYAPIKKDGKVMGVYEAYMSILPLQDQVNKSRMTIFGGFAVFYLILLAIIQISSTLMVKQNLNLKDLSNQLEVLAETDGLTGLNNHRHFQDVLEKELMRSARYGHTLSLVMIDLDGFKEANDRFGHQTGDSILREVSRAINNSVRNVDFCARYGGDELVVILPETPNDEAMDVAERLRQSIENIKITHDGTLVNFSASVGLADYPYAATDKNSLIAAADSALLLAKKRGRNQVCNFRHLKGIEVDSDDLEKLFHRLQHANLTTLKALAAAVDGMDDQPEKHTISFEIMDKFVGKLDLPKEDAEALRQISAIYDVGKIAVPERILSKSTPLTESEIEMVKKHPQFSQKMLAAADEMQRVLKAVLYHHERWDGSGYPYGLKGEDIPYLARIIHIADAYQSMIQDRPYRDALVQEEIISELRANAGTQFDPGLVETFISALSLEKKAKGRSLSPETSPEMSSDSPAEPTPA